MFLKNTTHSEYIYYWQGINPAGEHKQGQLKAQHLMAAKQQLRYQSIIVRSIKKKRQTHLFRYSKSIKSYDISLFFQHMATTFTTGLSLVQILELIASSQTNLRLQRLIKQLQNDLQAGLTLAEALRKHPKYFSQLICNLIAIGEESGTLRDILNKISRYLDNNEQIKQKMRRALTYPTAVMLIAVAVTVGLLWCVIPQFESLFRSFDADLPAMTLWILHLSHALQHHGVVLIVSVILLLTLLRYTYHQSPYFIKILNKLSLKLPFWGSLLQKKIMAQFASTLSITYSAGIPLVEALGSVALITSNVWYVEAILQLRHSILQGESLRKVLQDNKLFPDFVAQMINLGEETGTINTMLQHIARYYEETIEHAVHTLTTVFEPLIMALLGVLIGGLILAMYLPILKLGSIV
ncbi:MAG: type II secretion system F family protein [Legionellaceae bacterium]|nr:type II secretion system F family protein [Legionellaceae bacterium]